MKAERSEGALVKFRELDARDRNVVLYFAAQIVTMTFLQKFGFPIAMALPVMLAGVGLMWARGYATLSVSRLCLFGVFCVMTLISQLMVGVAISSNAVFLFIVIYIPILFYFIVSLDVYLYILDIFLNILVLIFVIVVYQLVSQEIWGIRAWPNLNVMPAWMQISPHFNYFRETGYNTGRFQPNGVFFLEPSFVSQFFALAIMMELVWLKRYWRLAIYAGGMIMSLAGSGLLILAVAAPVLAAKLPIRALSGLAVCVVLAIGVASVVGYTEQAGKRAGEFVTPGTSGYMRYTEPTVRMLQQLGEEGSIYTGHGAGSSIVDESNNVLPLTKDFTEYGLLQTVSFYTLFIFGMFAGTPSKRLALGFFLYLNLGGGGLTVPVYVLLCLLFCAQLRLSPQTLEEIASRGRPARPPFRRFQSPQAGAPAASRLLPPAAEPVAPRP